MGGSAGHLNRVDALGGQLAAGGGEAPALGPAHRRGVAFLKQDGLEPGHRRLVGGLEGRAGPGVEGYEVDLDLEAREKTAQPGGQGRVVVHAL